MPTALQGANHIALKEWEVTCLAVERGSQTLLLRKGGIDEGPDGFQVKHREFWLFPTHFHQTADDLQPEYRELFGQAQTDSPTGQWLLSLYARVESVFEVRNENQLAALQPLQILTPEAVSRKFHYRSPGLFVLLARYYRATEPIVIADSPHFAGCKSWIDLPDALPTDNLAPVIDDEKFDADCRQVRELLSFPEDA